MGKPFLLEYLEQLNKPATAKFVYELYVKSVRENYDKRLDVNRNKPDVLNFVAFIVTVNAIKDNSAECIGRMSEFKISAFT